MCWAAGGFFGDKRWIDCVVDPSGVGRLLHIVASHEGREHVGTLTPAEGERRRDALLTRMFLGARGVEKKQTKDAVFLLCHIVVITVIFNMK